MGALALCSTGVTDSCNSRWSSRLVVIKMSVVSWHLLPFPFRRKRKTFSKKPATKKCEKYARTFLKKSLLLFSFHLLLCGFECPASNVLCKLVQLSFNVKWCFHQPHYFLLCPNSNCWRVALKRSLTPNKQRERHEVRTSLLRQIRVELSARQISLSMPSRFMSLWL